MATHTHSMTFMLLATVALSRASTPCELERDAADQPRRVGAFAPRCDADGAFEPLQCSGSTGYCWCVDDLGHELAGTQAPPGRPRPLCAAASAVTACVPPRGRTMVLVGQDMGAVTNYSRDVGAHFSGVMAYTDLAALAGLRRAARYGSGVQWAEGLARAHDGLAIQLGLWMVGALNASARGALDANLDALGAWIGAGARSEEEGGEEEEEEQEEREADDHVRVVFLRIGYEFDNPDNAYYPPELFVAAFRRAAERVRAAAAAARARVRVHGRPGGVVATVWHAWGFAPAGDARADAAAWWPGDDVVDWVGVSLFQQAYAAHGAGNRSATAGSRAGDDPHALNTHTWAFAERIGELARARAKPLMVAEATPFGGLDCGGCARGADDDIWAAWFEPVFDFVARHDARALSYISCDWERGPMWRGMGWGDTRLDGPLADDASDGAAGVRARWRARLRDDPRYAAQGAAALARCFEAASGGGSAFGRPSSLPRAASSWGLAACAGLLAVAVLPQLARRRQRRRGYVTIQSPGLPKDLNLVAAAS